MELAEVAYSCLAFFSLLQPNPVCSCSVASAGHMSDMYVHYVHVRIQSAPFMELGQAFPFSFALQKRTKGGRAGIKKRGGKGLEP